MKAKKTKKTKLNSPQPKVAKKSTNITNQSSIFQEFEGEEINITELMRGKYKIKPDTWISDIFLSFQTLKAFYPTKNAKKPTSANYIFDMYDSLQNTIQPKDLKKYVHGFENMNSNKEYYLGSTGISKLMNGIQTSKVGGFPKITILAEENSVTFRNSDTHYYLGMIIGDPQQMKQLRSSNNRVAVCSKCDVMLLRFGFDWVLQRDDLRERNCPYCHSPLEIDYREGRIIKLDLNLNEATCHVDGGNNQLGVIYNGVPIKTTIWADGLLKFLKNYQLFFPSMMIGPFKIKLPGSYSNEICALEPLTLMDIEWRPIELFPEDILAF